MPISKRVTTTTKTTIVKRTTDLMMPINNNGTADGRYKYPQYIRDDGKRDKRTTPTHKKKKDIPY